MADCCTNFICSGADCIHFSSWQFTGATDLNTDDCTLFVVLDDFSGSQQVEVYKDNLHSDLVAIGQSPSAGVITLDERGGSGLSGTVVWDGTSVAFPSFLELSCGSSSSSDSSSSSSSIDSSSSESSSSESSSSSIDSSSSTSSESDCCTSPFCFDSDCANFSTWTFSGMVSGNTTDCQLYVVFDEVVASTQQVRVYSDDSFDSLVAAGERLGAGVITLSERNGSGLSGSVTWNGTITSSPASAVLDCFISSSSSDSSSSSSSSTSLSSSSSSFGLSSSSSSSDSSDSSSSSSSESSSSSSIDSSSTSSESEGNTSSSSSSSRLEWNKIKPLIFGNSATNSIAIKNRLAQTIAIIDDSYSIGTIYCYFYGPFGLSDAFTIHLEVRSSNDDGSPSSTIIASKTLAGSSITSEGWYSFDFDIEGETPSNNQLSFVLWQEDGDENNYVLWGYNYLDVNGSTSWFSSDDSSWTSQGVVRAMKIIGAFEPYDLENFRIETPPAIEDVITQNLVGGTLDDLKIETAGDYDLERAVIDHPDFIASFVIDATGSMGWNDRIDNRSEMVDKIIDRLKGFYPQSSNVLFDIIRFGSVQLSTESFGTNLGVPAAVSLDFSNPSRMTYIFDVSSASVDEGDIYEVAGIPFVVLERTDNENRVVAQSPDDPPDSGILIRTSGTGDATISYSTFSRASDSISFIGYGFRNLESGHDYNIGEILLDDIVIDPVSLDGWQTFYESGSTTLSVGPNGPEGSDSLDFEAIDGLVLRKPFALEGSLAITDIVEDTLKGSTSIELGDPSIVLPELWVDFINATKASIGHQVVASTDTTMEFVPGLETDMQSFDNARGIAQRSNSDTAITVTATTVKLFVKDPDVTRNITFYMQNSEGYFIEWDFKPFEDWIINSLFWLDQTAILPISAFDTEGDPLPNGTRVEFYVNEKPQGESNQVSTQKTTFKSFAGTDKVFVSSTSGFRRGDPVDIVGTTGEIQSANIEAIGTDPVKGPFIQIDAVLKFDVEIGSDIVPVSEPSLVGLNDATLLPSFVSMVDTTPIVQGRNLDPSLLEPYDPTPVSPDTTYDELNLDTERIRNNLNDTPSIDGCSSLRILPITEDNLKTVKEKRDEGASLYRPDPTPPITDQLEQNEGDVEEQQLELENTVSELTTTTTTVGSKGVDYDIDTPIFLIDGFGQSTMTSYATDMVEKEVDGVNVPGIEDFISNSEQNTTILVKEYDVFPAIVIVDSNGNPVAKQYIDPFQVSFTPPAYIEGIYDSDDGVLGYLVDQGFQTVDDPCPGKHKGYGRKTAPGVFATGDAFTINYIVTDRNVLVGSGSLHIRIYANSLVNLEAVVGERSSYTDSNGVVTEGGREAYERNDLNSKLPVEQTIVDGVVQFNQPLSEIDTWRDAVENNPQAERIRDVTSGAVSGVGGDNTSNIGDVLTNAFGDGVSDGFIDNLTNAGYSVASSEASSAAEFDYYANPEEWTVASQYGEAIYDQVVEIVDGRVVLEIPASDQVALLLIQASVSFGADDRFESIRSNLVLVGNPIDIDIMTPTEIIASQDKTDEVATQLSWKDEVIADDVLVNFEPASTDSLPSVSRTDDGWARGVQIGPHASVTMECPTEFCKDCSVGLYELITITADYLGYRRVVTRWLEWTGETFEETGSAREDDFPFLVTAVGGETDLNGWADGTVGATVESDLTSSFNVLYVTPDGIKRLRGFEQPDLPPNYPNGAPARVTFSAPGLVVIQEQQRWDSNIVSATIDGLDQNIGHEQPPSDAECCPTDNSPWRVDISGTTSYRATVSEDGLTTGIRRGIGVEGLPVPVLCGSSLVTCYPRPQLTQVEPLAIILEIESYEGAYARDGVDSPNIVATVAWRGEPITDEFTKNPGKKDETAIDFAAPDVTFQAGTCAVENISIGVDEAPDSMIDNRNTIDGCLTIETNQDVNMDAYTASVNLVRTDKFTIPDPPDPSDWIVGTHTHVCVVDEDGNGVTTSTINLDGFQIEDHTHTIEDFRASLWGTGELTHDHGLRSVAIVKLLPTTNAVISPVINGYVEYNPTFISTGRMMFATVRVTSSVEPRELSLNLIVSRNLLEGESSGNIYTAEEVTETALGFDIKACATFSSYRVEVSPGEFVNFPAEPVPDGTRIVYEISTFKPPDSDSNLLVSDQSNLRTYMIMSVKASVFSDGLFASQETRIDVYSKIPWMPNVKRLVPGFTSDQIYIDDALSNINTVGASQIHDAVKQSAQNIIQWQTDNPEWKDARKVIFLLTDGDENSSEFSIGQAIDNVTFIDGECEVPVIPIRLGYAYGSDDNLLRKYANDTCGDIKYLIQASETEVDDLVDDIVTDESINVNSGIYSNVIDLGSDNIAFKFSVSNVSLPSNSRVEFRVRYSSDGSTWSLWSEWTDVTSSVNLSKDLTSLGRYFQYEIKLLGNEFFESPSLFSGIEMQYYKNQTFTTFFQPVDLDINTDEYVASIHITHEGTIPDTSDVKYGYVQFDSTNFDDYFSVTRPLIAPDRHAILPTRYNEIFLTDNNQTYTAINGRWTEGAVIEVYRISDAVPLGELVDPSLYSVNSNEGTITFDSAQDLRYTYTLNIRFDPAFRFLCDVVNYGPNPVVIDHIGVLYNVTKRIPTDSDGNILHNPISRRLPS